MSLAFIRVSQSGGADETMRRVVATLAAEGWPLAGVVPQAAPVAGAHPCDRSLTDIRTGAQLSIHQALGAGSTGCRLDAGALEAIVATVASGLSQRRPELLIINRFGKLESGGRGFAPLIAQAVETGIPVLVGVNGLNREAFEAFAGGLAQELPDETQAVLEWLGPLLDRRAA